ncbi:MAG TPA: divalent-cation tolerance protein CutA [Anaeromyxobacteraceae bacterium]|nr:divalent-cation tolerance protein CutA [Anaeromyxobacteraceae bacterium]
MASEAMVVLVTAPTAEVAAGVARALVEEGLAACGNVVPGVRSIYRWEGKVADDAEALIVLKTERRVLPALKERLPQVHPYGVPELLAIRVEDGLAPYLAWLGAALRPRRRAARGRASAARGRAPGPPRRRGGRASSRPT